ncbi:MAG: PD40 domain-containing protein [Elusimicrobia bacterium]|nr:PD40 domain-containing protein [Elusimicrobiota bacterium]
MQQSNIVAVGDGTGGVTEAFKDRFMIFHDGSKQWLDLVATHELTHVFQYHLLVSGWWRSGRILKTIIYPLWMMEGMAEYFSWGLEDTGGDALVRDAASSDCLIPLWKLEKFSHLKPHQVRLAYESGAKALEFLEREYGAGSVARMLKLFESRFETSAVLSELTGLDVFAFDKKWREYEGERARRRIRLEGLREPEAYGARLTTATAGLPEFNSSPVFTPDGAKMAFLTTRDGFPPQVMLKDLRTGKLRDLLRHQTEVETVHLGNFDNVSRVLTLSPDGRTLVVAGTKNHADALWVIDLATRRKRRVDVPGFMSVGQPAFHPDGRRVAFSGLKDGVTDLWLLELDGGKLTRLSDDPADDQTPAFAPDGSWLVYTSEVEVPGSAILYQRRLRRLSLVSGASQVLSELPGSARDPVVSADGKRVLFALQGGGLYDVHEIDLASGAVKRLTRSIGAAYTPTYTPDGGIAYAALRRGSIHLYKGPRASFEDAAPAPPPAAGGRVVEASSAPARVPTTARSPYSTDLFLPAFFYSSNGGLFWTSYYQGSDLMGEHGVTGIVSYASGQGYLDYQGQYDFKRWRTDLAFGAVGRLRKEALDTDTGVNQDESAHAQFLSASTPLDRFNRVDLVAASVTESYDSVFALARPRREARLFSAAFVRDTVRGRYLAATGGGRLRLGYSVAPRILGGNSVREGVFGEAHRYLPTGGLSALVLRGQAAGFWGPDPPQYVLGGIGGVRGYGRSATVDAGRAGAVTTAEWRIPVLPNLDYYMWYIFPDFYFKSLSLNLFTDAGYAWSAESELRGAGWGSLRHSYGAGLSLHTFILQLFPLVLHFDYAQRTTSDGGVFYVYLGPLF